METYPNITDASTVRLDLTRLEKLRAIGNRHEAQCPACAEFDSDKSGNHLSIAADGRFCCLMYPGADGVTHRKRIFELVGIKSDAPRSYTLRPTAVYKPSPKPWEPYGLNTDECAKSVAMATRLANDADAIQRIANARNWRPETIRNLAFELCLGLHEGKLVYIYPTGSKQRKKPLTPGVTYKGQDYRQLFGKPSLWMGDRILSCTEKIHLVEGETAAISLIDAGLDNGTTQLVMATPGASSWPKEWASRFAGLEVLIWPDADDAGENHASAIVASLQGIARKVSIVRMEGGAV